jgi:hypothetical protein
MSADPEGVLVAALAAKSSVVALCGGRIGTALSGTYPAVRISLVGGRSKPVDERSTKNPIVQWEAWGDTQGQAADLAREIDDQAEALRGTYSKGIVVASWASGHYFHSPDPETNRQRYIGQIGMITQ